MKTLQQNIFLSLATVLFLLGTSVAHACPDIDGLADLNCDGQLEIICFGDSITYGERDEAGLGYPGRLGTILLPGVQVRNLGLSGENTSRGRDRASRRFSQLRTADYAIILEGVNDYFAEDRSSSDTRSNLQTMVRSASNSGAVPLLSSLTDIRRTNQRDWVRAVNSQIRSNIKIDFFSLGQGIISFDKLHPNGSGYQRMAELALGSLRQTSNANRPADVDGDGIYDFAESRYGTIVGVADTDHDGIPDGTEIFVYHTNALSADTDGDGFSDAEEINVRHTNPLSALPNAPVLSTLEPLP